MLSKWLLKGVDVKPCMEWRNIEEWQVLLEINLFDWSPYKVKAVSEMKLIGSQATAKESLLQECKHVNARW